MYDERYLRRKLTTFYIAFYIISFWAVVHAEMFLFNGIALVIFNCCTWVPQILHTYVKRTRRGPSLKLILALQTLQSLFPFTYLMGVDNFLDRKPRPLIMVAMVAVFSLQLFVMHRQKTKGPRWFVPASWRRDPNAYQYERQIPADLLQRAQEAQASGT